MLPTFPSGFYSEITAAFHISSVSVSVNLFLLPGDKKNKTYMQDSLSCLILGDECAIIGLNVITLVDLLSVSIKVAMFESQ